MIIAFFYPSCNPNSHIRKKQLTFLSKVGIITALAMLV